MATRISRIRKVQAARKKKQSTSPTGLINTLARTGGALGAKSISSIKKAQTPTISRIRTTGTPGLAGVGATGAQRAGTAQESASTLARFRALSPDAQRKRGFTGLGGQGKQSVGGVTQSALFGQGAGVLRTTPQLDSRISALQSQLATASPNQQKLLSRDIEALKGTQRAEQFAASQRATAQQQKQQLIQQADIQQQDARQQFQDQLGIGREQPTVPTPQAPVVSVGDTAPQIGDRDTVLGQLSANTQDAILLQELKTGQKLTDTQIQAIAVQERISNRLRGEAQVVDTSAIEGRVGALEGQAIDEEQRLDDIRAGVTPEQRLERKERQERVQRGLERARDFLSEDEKRLKEDLDNRGFGNSTYALERGAELADNIDRKLEDRRLAEDLRTEKIDLMLANASINRINEVNSRIGELQDKKSVDEAEAAERAREFNRENGIIGNDAMNGLIASLTSVNSDVPKAFNKDISMAMGQMAFVDKLGNITTAKDTEGNPIAFEQDENQKGRFSTVPDGVGGFVITDTATGKIMAHKDAFGTITGGSEAPIQTNYSPNYAEVGSGPGEGGGYRTDRHNNPTALAWSTGVEEFFKENGHDVRRGDVFPENPNAFTLDMTNVTDPVGATIDYIDAYTFEYKGQPRWSHTSMPTESWRSLTDGQKRNIIKDMYRKEVGDGSIFGETQVDKPIIITEGRISSVLDKQNGESDEDHVIRLAGELNDNPQDAAKMVSLWRSTGVKPRGKQLGPTQVDNFTQGIDAIQIMDNMDLDLLLSEVGGPVASKIPFRSTSDPEFADQKTQFTSTLQVVGKFLEGGVLKKDDVERYQEIMPQVNQIPEIKLSKYITTITLMKNKYESLLTQSIDAKFDVGPQRDRWEANVVDLEDNIAIAQGELDRLRTERGPKEIDFAGVAPQPEVEMVEEQLFTPAPSLEAPMSFQGDAGRIAQEISFDVEGALNAGATMEEIRQFLLTQ